MRPHHFVTVTLLFVVTFCVTPTSPAANKPVEKPAHRVDAIYFHRTQRCPTCRKISDYTEEAVKAGFTKEMKEGRVILHLVDFQNRKNQKYAEFYKITGPTLVVVDVHKGKVTRWKPMPKVWSLVFKKEDFFKYVQNGIQDYLEEKK